jgi:hypothetical protein
MLLTEYLQSSPDCAELFRLWEGKEKGQGRFQAQSSVADCLASIISPSCTNIDASVACGFARKVIKLHLQVVYNILSAMDNRVVQTGLRLLTAMVQRGGSPISRDLCMKFNLELEAFVGLPLRPFNKKAEGHLESAHRTRTCFCRLMLALLASHEPEVVRLVLASDNLFGSIMKASMGRCFVLSEGF